MASGVKLPHVFVTSRKGVYDIITKSGSHYQVEVQASPRVVIKHMGTGKEYAGILEKIDGEHVLKEGHVLAIAEGEFIRTTPVVSIVRV